MEITITIPDSTLAKTKFHQNHGAKMPKKILIDFCTIDSHDKAIILLCVGRLIPIYVFNNLSNRDMLDISLSILKDNYGEEEMFATKSNTNEKKSKSKNKSSNNQGR